MRFKQLDSLRGLGAIIVIVVHLMMTNPEYSVVLNRSQPAQTLLPWLLVNTPLHLFIAGLPGVILFFILSGFVLGLSIDRTKPDYRTFLGQRIARLFLPFAASVLLSALLYTAVAPQPLDLASAWFNQRSWTTAPSLALVAGHLAMLMYGPFDSLNHVMWTLAVELRIAVFLPLIVVLLRRWPAATLGAAFALMPVAYLAEAWHVFPAWFDSWLRTLRLLWLFVAGAGLALWHVRIAALLASLDRATATALWMVALLVFSISAGFSVTVLTAGFGALLLIAMIIARPQESRMLEHPLCLYLGKVSYSLYLVHLPVMLAVLHGFATPGNFVVLQVASFVLSVAVADVFYRLVERPCHRLAQMMGKRRTLSVGWTAPGPAVAPSTGIGTRASQIQASNT